MEALENSEQVDAVPEGDSLEAVLADYANLKVTGSMSIADYEGVLKRLAAQRNMEEALKVFGDIKEAGLKPTPNVYANVFRSGRRLLRIFELRELIGTPLNKPEQYRTEALPPNSEAYAKLKPVLEEMKAESLEFEQWFYDDCAHWFAGMNNAGMLINVAMSMEAKGISPSIKYYNKMLYTLPRCGFSDRSDMLFSRMLLNGLADMQSYVIQLGSLVYQGRFEEAATLYNEMEGKFQLNEIAYNTVIHGYLLAGQPDKAIQVLDRMKANPNVQPNGVTASTFVTYFYDSGRLEHARELLGYFKEAVNFPTNDAEQGLMLKFYARYDPNAAVKLAKELAEASPNFPVKIYDAILGVLADRKIQPDWKRTISEAFLDKTYPMKSGGLAEAAGLLSYQFRHVLARMEAHGVQPSSMTYDLTMRMLNSRKDYATVIRLFNQALQDPSILLYSSHRNHYLTALIQKGDEQERLEKTLQMMKMRRQPISAFNQRRMQEMGILMPVGAFVNSA